MSKQINPSIFLTLIAFVAVSVVLVGTTFGQVTARTTITLGTPVSGTAVFGPPFNFTVDSIVIDWSTSETTGVISESQLTGLTFSLLEGTTTVYTDEAILNSVVQPIGGVGRAIGDLQFIFDLDNLAGGLQEFDNDIFQVQAGSAVGETINLFGDVDNSNFTAFSNGVFFANAEFNSTNITVAVTAADDEFGSGVNTFKIDFVTIGNPGNPADTTGDPNPVGSVGYTYRIGKYEVSEDMIDKANAEGGLGITKETLGADKPATSVSWNEAARFVNWLNTSTGSAPAYKFEFQPGEAGYDANANIQLWVSGDAGYDPNNLFRNSQASYFLPSFDEWYKAAYYDPTSGTYFDFPTGSDTAPTPVVSGTTSDTAVYDQPEATDPADITQAGGLSPYGTMGQGGNAFEWQETDRDLVNDSGSSPRGIRGGFWLSDSSTLESPIFFFDFPIGDAFGVGFRVASVAEPGPVVLGDANDDGVITNDDIVPFVQALIMPAAYAAAYPGVDPDVVLDMNGDGGFDNDDVLGFVSALAGP